MRDKNIGSSQSKAERLWVMRERRRERVVFKKTKALQELVEEMMSKKYDKYGWRPMSMLPTEEFVPLAREIADELDELAARDVRECGHLRSASLGDGPCTACLQSDLDEAELLRVDPLDVILTNPAVARVVDDAFRPESDLDEADRLHNMMMNEVRGE